MWGPQECGGLKRCVGIKECGGLKRCGGLKNRFGTFCVANHGASPSLFI